LISYHQLLIQLFLYAEEVLRLIETLVKKEPLIMAVSHVPLFLCSYNASLSVVDQILLRVNFYIKNQNYQLVIILFYDFRFFFIMKKILYQCLIIDLTCGDHLPYHIIK